MSSPSPLRVLVTGAGGLLGGAVCATLFERGHSVVGLVHRAGGVFSNDGQALQAAPWRAGDLYRGYVQVVRGDVSARALGLDSTAATDLANSLDVIVHCAGVTGFELDQSVYDRINIAGAAHVADFALSARTRSNAPPPALVHVSTAYVCGDRSGLIPEAPAPDDTSFTNAYEASKAAAEIEVGLRWRRGLRVAVARPSIVVGDSRTGAIRRFGHFYGLMKLVAEGRIGVLPATPGATLDLAPIDYVVGGIVDIAERMSAADGKVFHLAADRPTPLAAFTAMGGDYPDLTPPRFVDPEHFDLAKFRPSEQRAFAHAVKAYAAYLQRDPQFEARNLEALSGRVCPPLGAPYLWRLLDYAIAAGFVRRPAPSGCPDNCGPAVS